jgi:hypothetical protein
VRVWHPEPGVDLWQGTYGGAPVETGPTAVQWNDGETDDDF